MEDNNHEENFLNSLRQIVQSSGEYFLIGDQVSDVVLEAVRQHTDFILTRLSNRLQNLKSISLDGLIRSFSDCPTQISRMYNYYAICSQQVAEEGSENLESLADKSSSTANIRFLLSQCSKYNIPIDPDVPFSCVPQLLLDGQAVRSLRIDKLCIQSSTADYIVFTAIRQKARLFGQSGKDRAFALWVSKQGLIHRGECISLLAYLVTQCVKDLIDVALANRRRFGINLLSQLTAIELQQATRIIQKFKSYV